MERATDVERVGEQCREGKGDEGWIGLGGIGDRLDERRLQERRARHGVKCPEDQYGRWQ